MFRLLLSSSLLLLNPGWAAAAPVFKGKTPAPTAQTGIPKLNPLALLGTPGGQVGNLTPGALQNLSLPQVTAAPTPNGKPSLLGLIPTPGAQAGLPDVLSQNIEAAVNGSDPHAAGRNIQTLIEGGKVAELGDITSGSEGKGVAPLGKSEKPQLPAVEDDRGAYQTRRAGLKAIAEKGIVASLPKAGKNLTASLIKEAGRRKAVFLDIDDTVAAFNSVLKDDMVKAINDVRAAGKAVVFVTDRMDTKRPNSTMLTVFESLESFPIETRKGLYVAAWNGGGHFYEYDAEGKPQSIGEAPKMSDEQKKITDEAIVALKAKLPSMGIEQHPGDALAPPEQFNPFGYSMMIKLGTTEAKVKEAAKEFQAELASRGFEVEVLGRMAKDPKNNPYLTFSVINKSAPVKWFSEKLGLKANETVAMGDSMFMPRQPETLSGEDARLKAEAERLSGMPMALTGNETDRNMEKGLPGLLALSVGGSADPRMENGWVLDGHGPEQTLAVLREMAKPATPELRSVWEMKGWEKAGAIAGLLGLLAAAGAAYYFMFKAFFDVMTGNVTTPVDPDNQYYGPVPTIDEIFGGMGGVLAAPLVAGLRGSFKKLSAWFMDNDEAAMGWTGLGVISGGAALAALTGLPLAPLSIGLAALVFAASFWAPTYDLRDILRFGAVVGVGAAVVSLSVPAGLFLPAIAVIAALGAAIPLIAELKPDFQVKEEGRAAVWATAAIVGLGVLASGLLGVPLLGVMPMLGLGAVLGGLGVSRRSIRDPLLGAGLSSVPVWLLSMLVAGLLPGGAALLGAAGMGGMAGMMMKPNITPNPQEFYKLALEQAVKQAKALGFTDDQVYFGGATVSMPVRNGDNWNYSFFLLRDPAQKTGSVVYVDIKTGWTAAPDFRTSSFKNVEVPLGIIGMHKLKLALGPEQALDKVIEVMPDFERAASVELRASGVYHFFDGNGGEAMVDSATGHVVPVRKPSKEMSSGWFWVYVLSGLAAIAGLISVGVGMGGSLKPVGVSDAEIESAAKSVAASKGGVWSQTEYNMGYYNTMESLKKRGATDAQLERFKKLCDDAPVINGRFNPWSGD